MSSAGPNFPTAAVNDFGVGGTDWINPGNATADDGLLATNSPPSFQVSHYLKATGFGFAIPTGATVNGIVLEVKAKADQAGQTDSSVKLVKGGVVSGTDKASNTGLPLTIAYRSYGSNSDLWGLAWTPADINAANFGAAFSVTVAGGRTASVDAFRITVYYTVPTPVNTVPPAVTGTVHVGSTLSCSTGTWTG